MILIPIGHDHGELRRWPVVSFTIIALCVAVSFVQYDMGRGKSGKGTQALKDAVEYYSENTDLTPDPELQQVFERALAAGDAHTRRMIHKEIEKKSGDEETRPERQEKLDALTKAWLGPMHENIIWRWGLIPAHFSWVKLVTSMFVHVGVMHLLFNMLFLYMTGPFIEDVWGRGIFAAFYLVGGMFADGMFALRDPNLDVPLVGASGAVAAVMGAFLIRYPRAKIRLLTFILWRRVIFSAPAWLLISLWFLGEYAEARASEASLVRTGITVANWAHVWGFGFGAAVGLLFRSLKFEERYFFEALEAQREAAGDPFQLRIDQLLSQGKDGEACRLIATELLKHPDSDELAETFWRIARGGPMRSQSAVCLRIIDRDLQRRQEERALERWFELHGVVPGLAPDVHLTVRLAQTLAEHGRRGDADELLVGCYRRLSPSSSPQEWAELARYCVDSSSPISNQVVSRALSHPRLPPDARADLERAGRLQGGVSFKQAG